MKRTLTFLALAAAVCIASLPAAAGTIFDDFATGNSYNCCSGWTVSGPGSPPGQFISANEFTAGLTGSVGEIDLAIGLVTGDGGGTAAIYTVDNNGLPGTLLGSWGFTAHQPFGNCCAIETITVNGGPTLTSGTSYFMVLSADNVSWDAWNQNTVGATGIDLFSTDNGNNWTNNGVTTLGTFRILTGAATPEPGTLALLASGLLCAAGTFRRKLNR